jgi:hypothetical protein
MGLERFLVFSLDERDPLIPSQLWSEYLGPHLWRSGEPQKSSTLYLSPLSVQFSAPPHVREQIAHIELNVMEKMPIIRGAWKS